MKIVEDEDRWATKVAAFLNVEELLKLTNIDPELVHNYDPNEEIPNTLTHFGLDELRVGKYGLEKSQSTKEIYPIERIPYFKVLINNQWINVSPKMNKHYTAALERFHLQTDIKS